MKILAIALAAAGAACWLWPGAFVGWLCPLCPSVSVKAWSSARRAVFHCRRYLMVCPTGRQALSSRATVAKIAKRAKQAA
jgi:hypothetical protein